MRRANRVRDKRAGYPILSEHSAMLCCHAKDTNTTTQMRVLSTDEYMADESGRMVERHTAARMESKNGYKPMIGRRSETQQSGGAGRGKRGYNVYVAIATICAECHQRSCFVCVRTRFARVCHEVNNAGEDDNG